MQGIQGMPAAGFHRYSRLLRASPLPSRPLFRPDSCSHLLRASPLPSRPLFHRTAAAARLRHGASSSHNAAGAPTQPISREVTGPGEGARVQHTRPWRPQRAAQFAGQQRWLRGYPRCPRLLPACLDSYTCLPNLMRRAPAGLVPVGLLAQPCVARERQHGRQRLQVERSDACQQQVMLGALTRQRQPLRQPCG